MTSNPVVLYHCFDSLYLGLPPLFPEPHEFGTKRLKRLFPLLFLARFFLFFPSTRTFIARYVSSFTVPWSRSPL